MKVLKYLIVPFTFAIILISGCSDKSQLPVAPIENGSLEKAVITNFTFTDIPIGPTGEGKITLVPGGKWQIKKYGVMENFVSSDPLGSGIMLHYLSATVDVATGEGTCQGAWTLTPTSNAGGGVWEGTYEGYRSESYVPGEWTLPLKIEGHGKGGTIDGMQLFANATLTIYTAGTTLPAFWIGKGEGFYKSH